MNANEAKHSAAVENLINELKIKAYFKALENGGSMEIKPTPIQRAALTEMGVLGIVRDKDTDELTVIWSEILAPHATADRTELDVLLADATAKRVARDAIGSPCSPEWMEAHKVAVRASLAARTERTRLWKADRWGAWMSDNDRDCARISGELY